MTDIVIRTDFADVRNYGQGRRVFTTSSSDISTIKTFFLSRHHPDFEKLMMFKSVGQNPVSWDDTIFHTRPGNVFAMAGWFENWTPGLDLEIVHLCCFNLDGADRQFIYIPFNTSTEAFGTVELLEQNLPSGNDVRIGITKLSLGFIVAFAYSKNGGWFKFWFRVGTDNWILVVDKSNPLDLIAGIRIDELAQVEMCPSTGGFDTSAYFIVRRARPSASFEQLNSGVWSGADIINLSGAFGLAESDMTHETEVAPELYASFSLAVHPFSGVYYVLYFPHEPDHPDFALRLISMSGATEPAVQLADVGVPPDAYQAQLTIDQTIGALYASWIGGTDGAWPNNVSTRWTRSLDGGASWQPARLSSAEFAPIWQLCAPTGFGYAGVESALFFVYHNGTALDTYKSTNSDNILVGTFTVDEDNAGNEVANCPVGQAMGASSIPGVFNPQGYPQYMSKGDVVYITVTAGKSGSLAPGDEIVGVKSKARGTFQGWSGASAERIRITQVRPGPYGVPFLPGELLVKRTDPAISVTIAPAPVSTQQSAILTDLDT